MIDLEGKDWLQNVSPFINLAYFFGLEGPSVAVSHSVRSLFGLVNIQRGASRCVIHVVVEQTSVFELVALNYVKATIPQLMD